MLQVQRIRTVPGKERVVPSFQNSETEKTVPPFQELPEGRKGLQTKQVKQVLVLLGKIKQVKQVLALPGKM